MTDDRESYGRLVNDTRRAFAAEQADDRGAKFFIRPWEERAASQQELDMRIGSAVAVQAVADAKVRNERLEAQVFALGAHLPAIRDALELAAEEAEYQAVAKRYRAALEALAGSDEKGADHG